jgi:drug/metabolite transporter (DMT)-like permease
MGRTAIIYALISAALFGASTPAAKILVGTVHPAVLAGLLYCGAGIGIAVMRRVLPSIVATAPEVALTRPEYPWLAGAILAGGVIGPLLLMAGLVRTDAATASLLLTLEGAATALMAWFIFHENFDRRIALGMAFLLTGAAVLSWSGTPTVHSLIGPLAIVGACLAWGLDNNLTRKVSLADPLQIVQLKGLIAGPFNLVLGLALGAALPRPFCHPHRGGSRLLRIWRELGLIRTRFATSRHGADRRLFLDSAFSRQRRGDCRAGGTNHVPTRNCRCLSGSRSLAASD